jgi:nucleoside diphosphate kinase
MSNSNLDLPSPSRAGMTFVFFDPWTLKTGRVPGMVNAIVDSGFDVLDFEFKTLTEADAEEIYRTNHPIREGNSWHVARLIYPMGRSIGLLFGMRRRDADACEALRAIKGKANPALNRPGQLRYDFKAPNRTLSLMHSSDDIEQVFREGSVFFDVERMERARDSAAGPWSAQERLPRQFDLELGVERLDEPCMGTLFARVRVRLALELARAAGNDAILLQDALASYVSFWSDACSDRALEHPVREYCRYLAMVKREPEFLRAVRATMPASSQEHRARFYAPWHGHPGDLIDCLLALSEPACYEGWDSARQLPKDIFRDPWERMLFMSYLFNFNDYGGAGKVAT